MRALRFVEGAVGLGEQIVFSTHLQRRDPDRGRRGQWWCERSADGVFEVAGDRLGRLSPRLRQEDAELVAADPRREVGPTQALLDRDRDLSQRLVTALVAEAVVDRLEVVQVEQQQRQGRVVAARCGDLSFELAAKVAPVREPGEIVGRREQLERAAGSRVVECKCGDSGKVGDELDLLGAEGAAGAVTVKGQYAKQCIARQQWHADDCLFDLVGAGHLHRAGIEMRIVRDDRLTLAGRFSGQALAEPNPQ